MKITIAYIAEEERAAGEALAALLQLYPGGKVRKSDRYAPIKHLYLTVKEPFRTAETPADQGISPGEGRGRPSKAVDKSPGAG